MPEEYKQVRFGVFEVNRQTRELRKHGLRIKLEDQPFEILAALLERPGEIVTRGELEARLWPAGTFVDFGKSLTKAVNKIRTALDDSAATPRFIETLSRRGYRFIAPVETCASARPAAAPPAARTRRAPRWRPSIVAAGGALAVFAALLLRQGADRLKAPLSPPGITSIAVLPLENLSGDPDQEYFADGLTDDLITDLGQIATLRVISRTSVMQYKRTRKPLPVIARELNVDAAVEGTVQRSGGRVRVTAQLLQARTDGHLWADTYERDFEDAIRLERQMAVAIAHEITSRLTPSQETRLAHGKTASPRAYDAYLHGCYFLGQRIEEPTVEAVGYFEQALREDPHFALAYSGLADCYAARWAASVDLPLAEQYARKALALEPDLAEAHASLGLVYMYTGRFAGAERELRRALNLNPNSVMAHHWRAILLVYFGRFQDALAENDRARQLDPFSLPVNNARMFALLGLRQYDQALEQAERLAELDPRYPFDWPSNIYWVQGRVPEAISEQKKNATANHAPTRLRDLDEIAAAYSRGGVHAAALKSAQIEEKGYRRVYTASEIACQFGLAGDQSKALDWLNQACSDDIVNCYYVVRSAPALERVRANPRFHELLRRLGLER